MTKKFVGVDVPREMTTETFSGASASDPRDSAWVRLAR